MDPKQRSIIDALPFIVWFHDTAGTPTYVNRHWTEYTGLDLAATLRAGIHTLVHPADWPEVERTFARAHEQGSAVQASYRLRSGDGAYRWHRAHVVPLRDDRGSVTSWLGTAEDVDEHRHVADEQRFLVEASKVLGSSLDLALTLKDAAQLVVPHMADWCAIDLATETGGFERMAVTHVDPAKVELAWELWRRVPPRPEDLHGMPAVVRTGRPDLFESIPDSLLVQIAPDAETLALYRSLGLRSSMCVPLTARGRTLGALSLVAAESERSFGPADLVFAEEFARRIAVAVDNAQLYMDATSARRAAEALSADVLEQSRSVEASLLAMRAERDAALARVKVESAQGDTTGTA